MTDQRLSELLSELAEPVAARGLSELAWQRAQLVRRRRRATVGAVAAVTVTAGVLALIRPQGNDLPVGDRTGSPTTAQPSDDPARPSASLRKLSWPEADPIPPDAAIAGAPVWLSPRPEAERRLPFLDSVLPTRLELTTLAPLLKERPLTKAAAAYLPTSEDGSIGPLLVFGPGHEGGLRRVNLPQDVGWVPDGQGNASAPLSRASLSPDGTRVALAREHEIVLLTLSDASWQRYPVRAVDMDFFQWLGEDTVYSGTGPVVDVRTGETAEVDFEVYPLNEEGYPIRSWWANPKWHGDQVAQSGFSTGIAEGDTGRDDPEVIAAGGDRRGLLVMHAGDPTGEDSRTKGCCEVVSWLDSDTVAFQSGTRDHNVLAWNTQTGHVARVIQVFPPKGMEGTVASYADLARY